MITHDKEGKQKEKSNGTKNQELTHMMGKCELRQHSQKGKGLKNETKTNSLKHSRGSSHNQNKNQNTTYKFLESYTGSQRIMLLYKNRALSAYLGIQILRKYSSARNLQLLTTG